MVDICAYTFDNYLKRTTKEHDPHVDVAPNVLWSNSVFASIYKVKRNIHC